MSIAGKRQGFGTYKYEDDTTLFEGEYVEDKIFGHGTITRTQANGTEIYEGECAGAAYGVGRFRFVDGSVYEGEVQKGKMHGDGLYYKTGKDSFEFAGQRAVGVLSSSSRTQGPSPVS